MFVTVIRGARRARRTGSENEGDGCFAHAQDDKEEHNLSLSF